MSRDRKEAERLVARSCATMAVLFHVAGNAEEALSQLLQLEVHEFEKSDEDRRWQ